MSWLWPWVLSLHLEGGWHVTHGSQRQVVPFWHVDEPSFRAEQHDRSADHVTLQFFVVDEVATPRALRSGDYQRQVGLKLRAKNSCNVIYVMWSMRDPALRVRLKTNPGLVTHDDCGNQGYRTLTPTTHTPLPPLAVGSWHTFAATIVGDELHVFADGRAVWRGPLPAEAQALRGPAGVRSDNVEWIGHVITQQRDQMVR